MKCEFSKKKNAIIYTHTYILKKDNKIMKMKITIRINNIRLAFMENHVFRLLMLQYTFRYNNL